METRREVEDGDDYKEGGRWRFKQRRKMATTGREKMEIQREEEDGGDYRNGGRWRFKERRKMVVITGGEEDGD